MRVLISAAEASSDAHGAELLKALLHELESASSLEAFGIGGPKLQACGFETVVDARELMVMGSTEVLWKLPKIFRALRRISEAAAQKKPDIAVVIDFPDFHFRLAKRLKKIGIPTIYYIPPKVWVWRKSRVRFLKRFFGKILCIFPFEESFYRSFQVPVSYVGNPLLDELPLQMTLAEARNRLSLKQSDPVLVLMPGSRRSELDAHMELMLQASALAAEKLRSSGFLEKTQILHVLMPFPVTSQFEALKGRVEPLLKKYENLLKVRLSQGDAHDCLVAADVGLVKSGTSTLEAGLLRCPHSIIYKPSLATAWIFKYLIRYKGPVGLVNLVSGWEEGKPYLVNEILMDQVTLSRLANEIFLLFTDQVKRQRMMDGYDRLREIVSGGSTSVSPSLRAAREIIQMAKNVRIKSC